MQKNTQFMLCKSSANQPFRWFGGSKAGGGGWGLIRHHESSGPGQWRHCKENLHLTLCLCGQLLGPTWLHSYGWRFFSGIFMPKYQFHQIISSLDVQSNIEKDLRCGFQGVVDPQVHLSDVFNRKKNTSPIGFANQLPDPQISLRMAGLYSIDLTNAKLNPSTSGVGRKSVYTQKINTYICSRR